jgi:hypothetical protein
MLAGSRLASAGSAALVGQITSAFRPHGRSKWRSEPAKFTVRKIEIYEVLQRDRRDPDVRAKILIYENHNMCILPPSRLDERGVRVVTNARRDAMDAGRID